MDPAAIGFRVKTGWAAAVLLGGPKDAPVVLDRGRLQLSDPEVPESRQPYHAGFGSEQTDARTIARLEGIVERFARGEFADLFRDYRAIGRTPRAAAVVAGSLVDPATIRNPHMRAHACEGRLYRLLIESAMRRRRLPVRVILERNLFQTAEVELGRAAEELGASLTSLRPEGPGPWRGEEKAAALAAWLTLAGATWLREPAPRRAARSGRPSDRNARG